MKVQRGSIFRPETNYYKSAGIILMVACLQFFLVVNLVETQFPDYSAAANTLTDIGGTMPLVEPSFTIFNISVFLLGVLGLITVYLVLKSGGCRLFSSCLALFSLGAMGVALVPASMGSWHVFSTSLMMLFGTLAVLFSYRLGLNIPMVGVSMVLGFMSFIILLFGFVWGYGSDNVLVAFLGVAGSEKFILYSTILYLIALGGYLTSRGEDWVRLRFFSEEK